MLPPDPSMPGPSGGDDGQGATPEGCEGAGAAENSVCPMKLMSDGPVKDWRSPCTVLRIPIRLHQRLSSVMTEVRSYLVMPRGDALRSS